MTVGTVLGRVHAEAWGRLLGGLIRSSGRPDLAEDALAEAFAQAAEQWDADGVPGNPAGWLATVARRRLLDAHRRERRQAAPQFRAAIAARQAGARTDPAPGEDADERLPLLFMATHPALAEEVRPALALRFVLGVPTETIARLFLVPAPTMAARLTRAKRRLTQTGVALAVPDADRWPERVDDVARAIYLAFTAGYAPGGDEVVRVADAGDAVRLAVLAADLLPGQPTLEALAALVQLHHARRDARAAADGSLVLLADQDRTRWRGAEIAAGLRRLTRLQPTDGYPEELRLQALIAAFHATAATAEQTDWAGIARCYRRLEDLTGSPVVRLNRAVAVGHAQGAAAGLALLRAAGERLPGNHRVALARAELLARDGRLDEARAAYREALAAGVQGAERRHIESRLGALDPAAGVKPPRLD
ncbi:MAG: sigma factor [Micropruina sp.]|uniref:RNA polymerase sigma factor n=1 Tax=Micropruina sp. TaxID=2737536 RepID=UPI0039E23E67